MNDVEFEKIDKKVRRLARKVINDNALTSESFETFCEYRQWAAELNDEIQKAKLDKHIDADDLIDVMNEILRR